jgi:hypothetical protein
MDRRITGQLIGLLSFDVGYEIDLERARSLIGGGEVRDIDRRRAAPAYFGYTTPPLRAPLGTRQVSLGEISGTATTSVTIHEFGALTIAFSLPLACELAALPRLTATLTGAGPLEDAARGLLEEVCGRLGPAIGKPGPNDFIEDYYIIQIERLDPPTSVATLLHEARGTLASAVRCEPITLSDAEVDDVFRTALSYSPDDLAVTDWNVAVIVDTEVGGSLKVLEFLNVQLLELRYYDAVLDRLVGDAHTQTAARTRSLPLLHRPYQRAIEELAAIRLEVALIFERIHNALKLSGDLYLAKLYARTAERLALPAWEASVGRKLEVLHQMYDVLVQRATAARNEALEATIVVLIVVEIIFLLVGWD